MVQCMGDSPERRTTFLCTQCLWVLVLTRATQAGLIPKVTRDDQNTEDMDGRYQLALRKFRSLDS